MFIENKVSFLFLFFFVSLYSVYNHFVRASRVNQELTRLLWFKLLEG